MQPAQFCHYYTAPSGKKFHFVPLINEDIEEVGKLCAAASSKIDTLEAMYPTPPEEFVNYMTYLAKRSSEDNMGVVAKDETNKIVAAACQMDHFNLQSRPIDITDIFSNKEDDALALLDQLESKLGSEEKYKCTKMGEIIFFGQLGVHPDYLQQGLGQEISRFVFNLHPVICKARLKYAVVTSPISEKIMTKLGWKIDNEAYFKDYKNSKGENPFANYVEDLMKIGLENFHRVTLMSVGLYEEK